MFRSLLVVASALSIASLVAVACSSSNSSGPPPGQTGTTCTTAASCYPTLDGAALQGQVTCLTQLQNGYCTHTCQSDINCCAAPGECPAGFTEVCAPLQSAPQTYCFLSCATVPANAGTTDPNVFCQRWANPTFTCRSTGGGANNVKFCGP